MDQAPERCSVHVLESLFVRPLVTERTQMTQKTQTDDTKPEAKRSTNFQ